MRKNEHSRYYIQSLVKGLRVLELMAEAGEPLTLSQIAESLGFNPTTAYRFLYTLESEQFVERYPETKAYRITPKVLGLGYGLFRSSGLWQTAHPYLVRAREKYGETFNLAILDGTNILYIDRVKTRKILSMDLEIGSKLPAYCTSMGRVLLAALPPEEARGLIEKSTRKKLTEKTVTSPARLEEILEQARIKGFTINDGQMALELTSVASPIRDSKRRVVAALNMAVHASQYSLERVERELAPIVMEVAHQISTALGYHEENNRGSERSISSKA